MNSGFVETVRGAVWRRMLILALFALGMAGSQSARAATLNVPAQYATIQDAVTAASPGDTILVANGTYIGAKNRGIIVLIGALTIKSSGGAANCIIDCQQQDRAFTVLGDAASPCRIEGFTVKNGSADIGGGIETLTNNQTIANCIFTNNTATIGGAGMDGGTAINCVFTGNSSNGNSGGMNGGTATNCSFTNNIAGSGGGGMYSGTAVNCSFDGNIAALGGGMGSGTATNCVFVSNLATSLGGGLYNCKAVHCTIVNNTTNFQGGGASSDGPQITTNCIVWGNTSTFSLATASDLNISGGVIVKYCDVQGGYAGAGNINSDPKFVSTGSGDFHLTASSPCINAATSTALPAGVTLPATDKDGSPRIFGSAPDIGAYEYGSSVVVASHNLIWQNSISGDVVYWTMNGTTHNGGGFISQGLSSDWKVVAYADITGDGTPDVIWQNKISGDVVYWTMNGTTHNGGGYLSQGISPDWQVVAVADITGDSKADLIWQNRISGDVIYWQMNGVTHTSGGFLSQSLSTDWKLDAVADVTGDGKADLIWQNQISGDVVYWTMNGTTHNGGGYLSQGISPDWQVVAASDLTGDSKADLIWQNRISGDVIYWQLNGITHAGGGFLSQGISPSWRIAGLN